MTHRFTPALQNLIAGFDRAHDHVVITDREGNILYANAAAERHTGFSHKEMIGKKPGVLWGGLMPEEFYAEMWDTIAIQKAAYVCELQNRTKDGRRYWQELHVLPVLDSKGSPEYFIGIELDLDAEEKRQSLIREYHERAHAIEQEVQVRWPLGGLLESKNLSPQQMEVLQQQYSSDASLDCLVDDLVALSNVAFTNQKKNESFCALALVQEIIHEIEQHYPERVIDFRHENISKAEIEENKKLLKETISRLVTNAVQYSEPTAGDVVITLLKTNALCVITCEDNGIGIKVHEQNRIFDKFFRGARARARNPRGSGLGLYLVKSIADMRGWHISFISQADRGTKFTLEIPLRASLATTS